MEKCLELTLCPPAFLCMTSSAEDVENERSKGMLSGSKNGFSTIKINDLDPLNKIYLSVAKTELYVCSSTDKQP